MLKIYIYLAIFNDKIFRHRLKGTNLVIPVFYKKNLSKRRKYRKQSSIEKNILHLLCVWRRGKKFFTEKEIWYWHFFCTGSMNSSIEKEIWHSPCLCTDNMKYNTSIQTGFLQHLFPYDFLLSSRWSRFIILNSRSLLILEFFLLKKLCIFILLTY